MATVTQENLGLLHEKIQVTLTKEDYLPAVDKALKQYSKQANVPGFRKGMVPVGIIRKMYGQSVFADEVLATAGRELENHLIQTKATIFARPLPMAQQEPLNFDINNPQDFSFNFEIGLRPDFEIELLKNKKPFPYYKVIVSHDMLQEEIERLQYKAGDMTEPEEVTGGDNVLNVTFQEVDADGNTVEGGIQKENSLLVKYFSPALQTQLLGKKNNDSIVFNLKETFDAKLLPAIMKDLELNPTDETAKEKNFRMLITKVGLITPAPLTKETFEKIYPGRNIETETEFKDILTEEIQRHWDTQSRTRMHNELFEALVHETEIQMPQAFLKRWMQEGGETPKTAEEVEKEFGGMDHQLRWQLITDKLVEQHQLVVEKEELEGAARYQIMSYFGNNISMNPADSEWMEPLVAKQLADERFREDLYHRILTDKIFEVLEEQIRFEEKNISLEEFTNLKSSHHHHHDH
jgi:trigger factor